MKLQIFFIIITIGILTSCNKPSNSVIDRDLDVLYTELDREIAQSNIYDKEKEQRVIQLRRRYNLSHDQKERTQIINSLIEEFNAYNADSALYYINCNLRRPDVLSTPGEYTRLNIKRADVLAHAGFFPEALATMRRIPTDSLAPSLREIYYSTYCAIFQFLSEYTDNHETAFDHEKRCALYIDSLSQVIEPKSFNHLVYVMTDKAKKGDMETAISVLSESIDKYIPGTREYSILASTLAYMYKLSGMDDEYKRYITLSAISDVKGAVKENMSFRALATVMFEDGDVERANRYLKKSIADANFYSALMRNVQSSKMLPVIDDAYSSMQQQMNNRLRNMLYLSSILSIALVIAIIMIWKQYKILHQANTEVRNANKELNAMSDKLKETNQELQIKNNELSGLSEELKTKNINLAEKNDELSNVSAKLQLANEELEVKNLKLQDLNRTTKQYAGLFMEYCSSAISAFQHYQRSLQVKTVHGGNRTELLKKIESTEVTDRLLSNFYAKFDEAILNIFPAFIDKFNALLKPEEQIILRPGELLNTELRLFALIRIGIDDSSKIAEFLRCSIATIYTYRSKMRKKALNPDDFENEVRNMA